MSTFTSKPIIYLIAILAYSCIQKDNANHSVAENETQTEHVVEYDSALARKYGADDYGMKKYVMALLKRGPNPSKDSARRAELQRSHLQNINRLAEEGKLVLAGPFFGSGEIRGIYIFNVESIEEAEALTNSDPSIQAGVLEMELKEWYGSAGLMAVNDIHKKLGKMDVAK
jgi:uncharacterized protein YciI